MKLLLLILLVISLASAGEYKKLQIRDWMMKVLEGPPAASVLLNKQYLVTVPSTVHLNLQKHKDIPDPFLSHNINSLQWVSSCRVSFTTTITISQEEKSFSKMKLIFEGIDTYADVFLNQKLIGSTNNAFIKYEFPVESNIKVGDNILLVVINSTKPYDTDGQRIQRMPFEYAHTRKACYQYSWDWAPYMNTMGIWLPVHLHLYDQVKIDYLWVRNKEITQERAVLDIVLALDKIGEELSINDNIELKIKHGLVSTTHKITSKFSRSLVTIDKPKLWWPNNIGTPHVYEFTFQLLVNDKKVDEKHLIHGIRTVSLNEQGANFQIVVNGYPIYCKGANYVPPDMMYPRVINLDFKPKNTFQQLLNDAVDSNFNMLRVWGGGQYEVDAFYEMASRKGIMIFQDFMFSDSIYPASDAFLQNVKKEILYQVRRLRNYPCLVLWSGNNEILQGIQSWGWGQPSYISNYEKVFKQLIPSILNIQSKNLPYIQSSPSRGVGNAGFGKGGDIHYWGVWAAGSPFQNYQIAVGGFNSEFGTQSLPVWRSILQFTTQDERSYASPAFASHQRHNSQFRTLRNYISRYAHASINFEHEAFVSGLVQAYGIEIAIRAQRIAKPKSYGTLYWQFNDAWPSISWSSIDYYGRWKPLQYIAKTLYSDIILFYHPKAKKVFAINDKLFNISAYYVVKAMEFDGKILFKEQGKIQLKANQNQNLLTIPVSAIAGHQRKSVVYTEITYGPYQSNKTVLTTFHEPYKNLDLQDAILDIKFLSGQSKIEFSSGYVIKSVFIDCQAKVKLSNNYFDVVPGHPVKVIVSGTGSLQSIKDKFIFKSYRQVFDPATLRITVN